MDSYLSNADIMAFGTMLLGTGVEAAERRRGLALAAILDRNGGAPLLPGMGTASPLSVLPGVGGDMGWAAKEAVCGICPNCRVSIGCVMTGDRRYVESPLTGPPRGTWLLTESTADTESEISG
jgi:hypothetical protein